MTAVVTLFLAWLGASFNLAFAGAMVQPDWALSILLGSLLAHRGNWVWVIPGVAMHDLMLHWSLTVCLPVVALMPLLLIYLDERLGPGLPQRLVLMFLATGPLLLAGWGIAAWLLTVCLSVAAWYGLTQRYAYAA